VKHKQNRSEQEDAAMNSTVRDQIAEILIEELEVEPSQIVPEAGLESDLGADSLQRVEILMKLEERFGLALPDQEADEVRTVGEIVNWIESKLAKGESLPE
jgi:acyl carrier protein